MTEEFKTRSRTNNRALRGISGRFFDAAEDRQRRSQLPAGSGDPDSQAQITSTASDVATM